LPSRHEGDQSMRSQAQARRRWTASEVRQLTADAPGWWPRYELVEGELLVTPSPGMPHQEAVRLLLAALGEYCDREPTGHAIASPSDVELEPEDVRQPDVYVMPRAEWRRVRHLSAPAHELLLAVEVISPSSARYDRVTKRAGYQRNVPEYWIVDLEARLIERWRSSDERPEIVTNRLTWTPPGASTEFTFDVAEFFGRIWD
jgi:Uma2 family endonuclease